jgi:GTP-binding protein
MLISAIDYNDYLGRIGIGKVYAGTLKTGDNIVLISREGSRTNAKITRLYQFENIKRVDVNEISAGDIGGIAGLEDVDIGDTIADPDKCRTASVCGD